LLQIVGVIHRFRLCLGILLLTWIRNVLLRGCQAGVIILELRVVDWGVEVPPVAQPRINRDLILDFAQVPMLCIQGNSSMVRSILLRLKNRPPDITRHIRKE
jgi:hypothetical protein